MPPTDVVFGAGSGMGAAIARRLATSGRRLLLADMYRDRAALVADELDDTVDVDVHGCDVTDAEGLELLAAATRDLGTLVVTAGISPTMAPGRRIFEVDLIGPAQLLRAFEPIAGPASVGLLLASMAGHLVPPVPAVDAVLDDPRSATFFDDLVAAGIDVDEPGGAYAFAKRGLIRLVAREAVGWGRRGARLLSLSPGVVDTPMGQQEATEQPMMATMVSSSSLGRMLTTEEITAVAMFLVSDAASAMTGTDVLVDGGAVSAARAGTG